MTTLTSETLPEPMPPATGMKRPDRRIFGDAGRKAIRTLGLVVVLLSVFVSSGSFLIMTGATDIEPTPEVWTVIWVVNGLLVLAVVALVLTEASLLIQARLRAQAGAALQVRMVTMFAMVAAIPAMIVAIVAMIENGTEVANHHRKEILWRKFFVRSERRVYLTESPMRLVLRAPKRA